MQSLVNQMIGYHFAKRASAMEGTGFDRPKVKNYNDEHRILVFHQAGTAAPSPNIVGNG